MPVSNALAGETIVLVSTPDVSFELAASCLSRQMDLSLASARQQLRSARLALPTGEETRRFLALLRTMGIEVAAPEAGLFAASIRAPNASEIAVETVVRTLRQDRAAVAAALNAPWGLLLTDLPQAELDRLTQELRPFPAVMLTSVANVGTSIDIFAPKPIPPRQACRLSAHIAQRGLAPCRISGALIGNLCQQAARQITSRFDDCGLLALPRAFQRFDLYLTGIGRVTPAEVMDFLRVRGDHSGRIAQSISPLAPLCVDSDLSRAAALAFCADYAAIGLDVSLKLMGGNS